jgi:hypothetical protein
MKITTKTCCTQKIAQAVFFLVELLKLQYRLILSAVTLKDIDPVAVFHRY